MTGLEGVLSRRRGAHRDALIPILQEVREVGGCVSQHTVVEIDRRLGLAASQVRGVATCYDQFRFQPRGCYNMRVHWGTTCHVKGSLNMFGAVERTLGIKAGQTTRDGLLSTEAVACLGTCGLAPVLSIHGEFHSGVTQESIGRIVSCCRKQAAANA
jgi:NADH-quinone oxidoreductase subunit E